MYEKISRATTLEGINFLGKPSPYTPKDPPRLFFARSRAPKRPPAPTHASSPADLPGFTRSVYERDHALITPESRVYAPLFGWRARLPPYPCK